MKSSYASPDWLSTLKPGDLIRGYNVYQQPCHTNLYLGLNTTRHMSGKRMHLVYRESFKVEGQQALIKSGTLITVAALLHNRWRDNPPHDYIPLETDPKASYRVLERSRISAHTAHRFGAAKSADPKEIVACIDLIVANHPFKG